MARMIVAGNWKMNTTYSEAVELARNLRGSLDGVRGVERVLIPPFPWIVPVRDTVSGTDLKIGAQNCYTEPKGAFTGEVAPEMLSGICDYVLAGHSERRHVLGETDELIRDKVAAIVRSGLTAILCVGETIEEREAGTVETVVKTQLSAGLSNIDRSSIARIVIAYEPVWAIGTGKAASADDAQEMGQLIREVISERYGEQPGQEIPILYGGSVKGDNAGQFMACRDIDGALVGGASLDASEFTAIVKAAAEHTN